MSKRASEDDGSAKRLQSIQENYKKAVVKESIKSLSDSISSGIIKADIITPSTIWNYRFTEHIHESGYAMFKMDEYLSQVLYRLYKIERKRVIKQSGATIVINQAPRPPGMMNAAPPSAPLLDHLRTIRTDAINDIRYERNVALGRVSSNCLLFRIECKILLLNGIWNVPKCPVNYFRSAGMIMPRKRALDWVKEPNGASSCTCPMGEYEFSMSECLINLAVLARSWNELVLPSDETEAILNYLQFHFARVLLYCGPCETFLDGVPNEEVSPENREDRFLPLQEWATVVCTVSDRFLNDVSLIFLALWSSHRLQQMVMKDVSKFIGWEARIFATEPHIFSNNVPDAMARWFEEFSTTASTSQFLSQLVGFTQDIEMLPAERLMYLARHNNVDVRDPSRIFHEMRSAQMLDYWNVESIEKGTVVLNPTPLKTTGRLNMWSVALILLFDIFMESKCHFPWRQKCFFSEARFAENPEHILRNAMPIIFKIRAYYYLHYKHRFVLCGTIDRAIYLWVWILSNCKFLYDTVFEKFPLGDLKPVWSQWIVDMKPEGEQEQEEPENIKRAYGIGEISAKTTNSIFTVYEFS